MSWWCSEYGKNVLSVRYYHDECDNCHLKDDCVRESVGEEEVPFFLTFEEAILVAEMFDSHDSEIATKMANQTLYYTRREANES